jgi:hypothetical protein
VSGVDLHEPWLNPMGLETCCTCGQYWEPVSPENRVPALSAWLTHRKDHTTKNPTTREMNT